MSKFLEMMDAVHESTETKVETKTNLNEKSKYNKGNPVDPSGDKILDALSTENVVDWLLGLSEAVVEYDLDYITEAEDDDFDLGDDEESSDDTTDDSDEEETDTSDEKEGDSEEDVSSDDQDSTEEEENDKKISNSPLKGEKLLNQFKLLYNGVRRLSEKIVAVKNKTSEINEDLNTLVDKVKNFEEMLYYYITEVFLEKEDGENLSAFQDFFVLYELIIKTLKELIKKEDNNNE